MNQRSEERAAAQQSEEEAAGASDPSTWKLMRVFSRRQEKREAVCLPSSSVITDCSIDAFNGLHSSTSPAFLSSSPLTYFSCAGRLFDFFFFPFTSSAHFSASLHRRRIKNHCWSLMSYPRPSTSLSSRTIIHSPVALNYSCFNSSAGLSLNKSSSTYFPYAACISSQINTPFLCLIDPLLYFSSNF